MGVGIFLYIHSANVLGKMYMQIENVLILVSKTKEVFLNMATQIKPAKLRLELAQFHGTEQWFRHSLNRGFIYTEGFKHLLDRSNAYWLLDQIALSGLNKQHHNFQHWTIEVNADSTAKLTCDDGNNNVIKTIELGYTDFPLSEYSFYVIFDGRYQTALLKGEY